MSHGFDPDHQGATIRVSPNVNERRDGLKPDILLLHYTGMESGQGAEDWLCNPQSEVSCHYIVHEDGHIVQMVPEDLRAWHAGKGAWQGREDVNSRSIGIEIVNGGHEFGLPDFPDVQIEAVIALAQGIIARHGIAARNVLAHSDIAPVRKRDPGEKFPWHILAANDVGHWVQPSPVSGGRFFGRGDAGPPVEALQAMLAWYGYNVPVTGEFCDRTEGVVEAFQRHFRRERVDGVADQSTIETLHRLASSVPVPA